MGRQDGLRRGGGDGLGAVAGGPPSCASPAGEASRKGSCSAAGLGGGPPPRWGRGGCRRASSPSGAYVSVCPSLALAFLPGGNSLRSFVHMMPMFGETRPPPSLLSHGNRDQRGLRTFWPQGPSGPSLLSRFPPTPAPPRLLVLHRSYPCSCQRDFTPPTGKSCSIPLLSREEEP